MQCLNEQYYVILVKLTRQQFCFRIMEYQKASNPHQNHQSQVPEAVVSLQLLSHDSAIHLQDNNFGHMDKRPSCLASVNNFIKKTFAILQEKRFQSIVSWSQPTDFNPEKSEAYIPSQYQFNKPVKDSAPSSFKIHNLRAFEEVVLPQYFKHSNMSSFVRQLNMYNFHKVRGDKNEIQFEHQKFKRNRPQLLSQIRRKQVESTASIPSLALLFNQIPEEEKEAEKQKQKDLEKGTIQALPQQSQSPLKKQSSQGKGSADQQQSNRLKQLLELNKSLKRQRLIKSNQLKQLADQAKTNMANKFNKTLLSLFAAKIQHNISAGKEQISASFPDNSFTKVHQMIGHVMDSSAPLTFKDLMDQARKLFHSEEPILKIQE